MTTLTDLRLRVLDEIGLTAVNTERGTSSTGMVDGHILRAIEELQLYLPVEAQFDVAVVGGARSFSLSALTRPMRVIACEYPVGNWPRTFLDFDTWGTTVTLDHSPPSSNYVVRVSYAQRHLVDAGGSTLNIEHEVVALEGAIAMTLLALTSQEASTRPTATAVPVYDRLRTAQVRLARWRDQLRYLGGQNRRRTLYAPSTTPTSKTIVQPI